MLIIGFCNFKGGVGKTTSCQNIAVALARKGKRVAVVDMDPQSNLTTSFGANPAPDAPQVYDLLTSGANANSDATPWDELVIRREGVDVIPSSLDLVMAELDPEGPIGRDTLLRDALAKVAADRYDFIFLDSPPQLGIFTRNVLTACDYLLIPMDDGFYGLAGLRLLNDSIPVFRERLNPDLKLLGILMTRHNPRTYISNQICQEIDNFFGPILFKTRIRQNVSLTEASSLGMSVFGYAPDSKGAEDYMKAADEFLVRCEHNGQD